jgi:hypothetical protein
MPNDNDLSLLQLSKKLTILLDLGAPKRVSEIARFDRRFMERKSNHIVFHLPGLSKSQTDNICRSVQYDKIDTEKLCVVHCCPVYEERTESFRSQLENEPDLRWHISAIHTIFGHNLSCQVKIAISSNQIISRQVKICYHVFLR